jgi:hypothetical protein
MTLPAMLACLLLQQTWIVDDTPGPGVSFNDIPPAVTAAADGDILLVQPGTYSHFNLSGKGLRILGSGSSVTLVQGPNASGQSQTTIASVPSSSLAYLDRLGFLGPTVSTAGYERLVVSGPTTGAVLADVTITGTHSVAALRVSGALVEITRSSLQGGAGVVVFFVGSSPGGTALLAESNALVHVSSSSLAGGAGGSVGCAAGNGGAGGAGVSATSGSEVWIADTTTVGGSGGCCSSAGFCPCGPGGPGIVASNTASVRISGDSTSLVQGGNAIGTGGPCSISGAGILASGGTVVVHSVPVLAGVCLFPVSVCTSPPTSGGTIVLNAPSLPVLEVSGTLTPAGSATLSFSNGPSNAPFLLAFAGAPVHLSAGSLFLGEILIDPANWFLLTSGMLSATGDFVATIPLAGIAPSFLHFPVYMQGIALDPSGTFWRVSNSTVATIRP